MNWFKVNFNFPDHFGNNWDAVWDCLNEINENQTVKIKNKDKVYSKSDYLIFVEMIDDFNKNSDVKINLV